MLVIKLECFLSLNFASLRFKWKAPGPYTFSKKRLAMRPIGRPNILVDEEVAVKTLSLGCWAAVVTAALLSSPSLYIASEAAVSRIFSVEDFSNTAGSGLFSILGGFFSAVSELGGFGWRFCLALLGSTHRTEFSENSGLLLNIELGIKI
jgi:hypothetical protein